MLCEVFKPFTSTHENGSKNKSVHILVECTFKQTLAFQIEAILVDDNTNTSTRPLLTPITNVEPV